MIHCGDGIAGLAGLRDVALVLSDLPSGETAAPFDRPIDLQALWTSAHLALRPAGVVALMAHSFAFAAKVAASNPGWFRYDLIWNKSMATGFLSASGRPLRRHEFVLVFAPTGSSTFNPQMFSCPSPIHASAKTKSHGQNYGGMTAVTYARAGATDRHPVSVLDFASVGPSDSGRIHPQQKPETLITWLVRTYSNPGDLVVDVCAGSGVVGRVAEDEGRRWEAWEIDPDIAARARGYTAQVGLLQPKAMEPIHLTEPSE